MKLSLRQKLRAIWGMGGLMVALIFFAGLIQNPWPLLPAAGCGIALVFLNLKWWHCPNCGKWLGRTYGEYCQHCGGKIDYDAK